MYCRRGISEGGEGKEGERRKTMMIQGLNNLL
jgi:hypothetical protein